jgi:glutamate-1-semialdehyde aminotransferase
MAFFRFRGAKSSAPPDTRTAEPEVEEASADADGADGGDAGDAGDDDVDASLEGGHVDIAAEEREWRDRAEAVIPGGASTGSKRADVLFGAGAEGPTHFVRASGCTITTAAGQTFIDCTMALGAVAIGYGDRLITESVVETLAAGNVAGLSHMLEVEVAERLCEQIPCAEQVRFLKTGAEAVAAAVRLARTATSRAHVIGSGYFGWLDWSSAAAGVPEGARADFTSVPFDDIPALESAAREIGGELAAVVLEPVVERLPSPEWIAAARSICDRAGAVLIFDEIKTGFRISTAGYQEYAKVEPDLATFGKAMANGFPLAAVVGRAAIMESARETWISSTLASEGAALAAARAVLEWHEKAEVCESLWTIGREMRGGVEAAVRQSGIEGVSVDGIDPMWLLRFDHAGREARFLEKARAHGVLLKRGAYNFAALAHDEDALAAIERAASTALVEMIEEEERGDVPDDGRPRPQGG